MLRDTLVSNPTGLVDPSGRPVSSREALEEAQGWTGTDLGYGRGALDREEYNPDLAPREWRGYGPTRGIVDRMRREEAMVAGMDLAMNAPILSAHWSIPPVSQDPADLEVADFLTDCLWDTPRHSFRHLLTQYLEFKAPGSQLFEWSLRLEGPGTKWVGKAVLDNLAPRPAHTVHAWHTDTSERFTGITQVDYTGRTASEPLSATKLLRFCYQGLGTNFEGRSAFRACYRPYYFKREAYRHWGIGVERGAVGIPVMDVEPMAPNVYKTAVRNALVDIRNHQKGYAMAPPGANLRAFHATGTSQAWSPLELVTQCNYEFVMSTLTGFLMTGQNSGSQSLHNGQTDYAANAFYNLALPLCEVLNDGNDGYEALLAMLVRLNFPGREVPKLQCSGLQWWEGIELLDKLAPGVKAGLVDADDTVKAHVRGILKLPESEEEEPDIKPPALVEDDPEDIAAERHGCEPMLLEGAREDHPYWGWRPLTKTERFLDLESIDDTHNSLRERMGAVIKANELRIVPRFVDVLAGLIRARDFAGIRKASVPGRAALVRDVRPIVEEAAAKGYATVAESYLRQTRGLPVYPEAEDQDGATPVTLEATGRHLVLLDDEDDLDAFPGAKASGAGKVRAEFTGLPNTTDMPLRDIVDNAVATLSDWVLQRIKGSVTQIAQSQAQSGALDVDALLGPLQDLSGAVGSNRGSQAAVMGFQTGRAVAQEMAKDAGLIARSFYSAILDGGTCAPCRETEQRFGEAEGGFPDHKTALRFLPPNPRCVGERYGNSCRCMVVEVFTDES